MKTHTLLDEPKAVVESALPRCKASKKDLLSLARSYGCEIEICANGRIYIHAPEGKFFLSCDSASIGYGGSNLPSKPTQQDFNAAYHFFKSEINEGIELDE